MVNIKHMPSMSPVSRFPGIRYERVPVARGVNHRRSDTVDRRERDSNSIKGFQVRGKYCWVAMPTGAWNRSWWEI